MNDRTYNMQQGSGRSVIHRIHPVIKLAWLLWLAVVVFVNHSTALPVLVACAAVGVLWIAGIAPFGNVDGIIE